MEHFLTRQSNECRMAYLSPSELLERLDKKAVLYLPIGSIEWHNEHLPLGTDTFHAQVLACELCEKIGGVALPAYWWNTGACHRSQFTYYMPEDFYAQTLTTVIRGLADFPAKLLVLINGHGGNNQVDFINEIAEKINAAGDFPIRILVADPYNMAKGSSCRIDHANTGETSVAFRLIPHLVRMERGITPDILSGRIPFTNRGMPSLAGGKELIGLFTEEAVKAIEREYAGL